MLPQVFAGQPRKRTLRSELPGDVLPLLAPDPLRLFLLRARRPDCLPERDVQDRRPVPALDVAGDDAAGADGDVVRVRPDSHDVQPLYGFQVSTSLPV